MKKLTEQSTPELEQRLADLQYALVGLAQLGGGGAVVPKEGVAEREALKAELKRRQQSVSQ